MEEITRHNGRADVSGAQAAPVVILVHGLWFGSWSLGVLARRLRKAGFETRRFRYRATRSLVRDHANALRDFVRDADGPGLHFVAHSLGGLVTLRMLADCGNLPPGRVLLLGSPLRGSTVARKAGRLPGIRRLLGRVGADLETGHCVLPGDRETGVVAGSRNLGLGYFLGGVGEPSDGTVAIGETRVDFLTDHLVLPVTHTGMLFSPTVADRGIVFLRTGRFAAVP